MEDKLGFTDVSKEQKQRRGWVKNAKRAGAVLTLAAICAGYYGSRIADGWIPDLGPHQAALVYETGSLSKGGIITRVIENNSNSPAQPFDQSLWKKPRDLGIISGLFGSDPKSEVMTIYDIKEGIPMESKFAFWTADQVFMGTEDEARASILSYNITIHDHELFAERTQGDFDNLSEIIEYMFRSPSSLGFGSNVIRMEDGGFYLGYEQFINYEAQNLLGIIDNLLMWMEHDGMIPTLREVTEKTRPLYERLGDAVSMTQVEQILAEIREIEAPIRQWYANFLETRPFELMGPANLASEYSTLSMHLENQMDANVPFLWARTARYLNNSPESREYLLNLLYSAYPQLNMITEVEENMVLPGLEDLMYRDYPELSAGEKVARDAIFYDVLTEIQLPQLDYLIGLRSAELKLGTDSLSKKNKEVLNLIVEDIHANYEKWGLTDEVLRSFIENPYIEDQLTQVLNTVYMGSDSFIGLMGMKTYMAHMYITNHLLVAKENADAMRALESGLSERERAIAVEIGEGFVDYLVENPVERSDGSMYTLTLADFTDAVMLNQYFNEYVNSEEVASMELSSTQLNYAYFTIIGMQKEVYSNDELLGILVRGISETKGIVLNNVVSYLVQNGQITEEQAQDEKIISQIEELYRDDIILAAAQTYISESVFSELAPYVVGTLEMETLEKTRDEMQTEADELYEGICESWAEYSEDGFYQQIISDTKLGYDLAIEELLTSRMGSIDKSTEEGRKEAAGLAESWVYRMIEEVFMPIQLERFIKVFNENTSIQDIYGITLHDADVRFENEKWATDLDEYRNIAAMVAARED